MVERCVRCGVLGTDVKLFDAVYDGRMEKICERCAIIENVPIIKKPDALQLKKSEESITVQERMQKIAGVLPQKKEETFSRIEKIKELDEKPELELPEKEKLNLIDNFHWYIMKSRRYKRLSQEQLAKEIGEPDLVIKMIEKGKLPENPEKIIKKLEQFFQIRLRKINEYEKKDEEKPVLLNKEGEELEIIPEPEIEIIKNTDEESENEEQQKIEEINIKEINSNAVTIADLRTLHRKKIEATKMEKIEEQKRIEERQRLIEARREELRLKKQKEANELDKILGGEELLKKKKEKIDFEDELI